MDVRFLANGQPCVLLVSSRDLRELVALVERTDRAEVYAGRMPSPVAGAFVRAGRHVLAIAELVPQSEPKDVSEGRSTARWATTKEAAGLLGITDRAVRKRIATGSLVARRLGGQWFIDTKEIADAAA